MTPDDIILDKMMIMKRKMLLGKDTILITMVINVIVNLGYSN